MLKRVFTHPLNLNIENEKKKVPMTSKQSCKEVILLLNQILDSKFF